MYESMQDIFTFDVGARPHSSEKITPHKFTVMCLTFEYHQLLTKSKNPDMSLSMSETSVLTDKEKRVFMGLLLDLLQCPDMDLKAFRNLIDSTVNASVLEAVYDKLESIARDGIKPMQDFLEQQIALLMDPPMTYTDEGDISRDSIMGVYIRRMLLAYNEMSFSQVVKMANKVKDYFEAGFPERKGNKFIGRRESWLCPSESEPLSMSHLDTRQGASSPSEPLDSLSVFSKKQAEYFMARQALMLGHNQWEALQPDQLQIRLRDILAANPDIAEAHFLSYMNNLRVKEYCAAVRSLYHYFDRKASAPIEGPAAKKKPAVVQVHDEVAMRYAALNLASLQYRFGNKDECRAALEEAIMLAQEGNDQVCLQHALVWLNLLGGKNTSISQLERSIKKTIDLNLPNLTVYGLNNLNKAFGMGTESPAKVIHYFTQSNLINCMNSYYGLMASGYAQRAAIWLHYGKRELCSLDSHVVLNIDTSINDVYFNGQPVCIAMCNLALMHADLGDYVSAAEILAHTRQQFPSGSGQAEEWQACQQRMAFTRAIYSGRWADAEQALVSLQAVDEDEAKIRRVVLLREKGKVTEAFDWANCLLAECEADKSPYSADFMCRVLLELSSLYISSGEPTSATLHVTECIALASKHHLELLESLATAHLAFVQLELGLPMQAVSLLESRMLRILSHARCYDKARVLHLYARCQVAAANSGNREKKLNVESKLKAAARLMESVIQLYHNVEAHMREKDSLHFLAMLHHSLTSNQTGAGASEEGYHQQERNKCARQFKVLDMLYPTLGPRAVSVL